MLARPVVERKKPASHRETRRTLTLTSLSERSRRECVTSLPYGFNYLAFGKRQNYRDSKTIKVGGGKEGRTGPAITDSF